MSEQRLKTRRSCDALGVCQQHKPACKGCTVVTPLRLAPGVLDAYRTPFLGSPAQRRELLRYLRLALVLMGGATALGWLAGLAVVVLL